MMRMMFGGASLLPSLASGVVRAQLQKRGSKKIRIRCFMFYIERSSRFREDTGLKAGGASISVLKIGAQERNRETVFLFIKVTLE
jgi:hypothetical protein